MGTERFKYLFKQVVYTGGKNMSRAQVQPTRNLQKNTATKIFRLKYRYYVTASNNKIGVILRKKDGGSMEAFLDPARIKKVMVVAVPSKPEGSFRTAVVVMGDKISLKYYKDEELEMLRKQGATVYPDHELALYIAYETNHDYYKPAELDSIDGVVLKEGTIHEFLEEEKMIQPCGKYKWRVYLYEIKRWDNYCFDLKTAFQIILTNIHPVYGVMD
jgi:hypothetical protein